MPLAVQNARNKISVWNEICIEYHQFIAQYNVAPIDFNFRAPSDWLNSLDFSHGLTIYLHATGAPGTYTVYLMGVPKEGGPRVKGYAGTLRVH